LRLHGNAGDGARVERGSVIDAVRCALEADHRQAFSQIAWVIAYKWNAVTGGDQGLPEIPYPDLGWMKAIPGLGERSTGDRFYLSSIVLIALSPAMLHRVVRSPFAFPPRKSSDRQIADRRQFAVSLTARDV